MRARLDHNSTPAHATCSSIVLSWLLLGAVQSIQRTDFGSGLLFLQCILVPDTQEAAAGKGAGVCRTYKVQRYSTILITCKSKQTQLMIASSCCLPFTHTHGELSRWPQKYIQYTKPAEPFCTFCMRCYASFKELVCLQCRMLHLWHLSCIIAQRLYCSRLCLLMQLSPARLLTSAWWTRWDTHATACLEHCSVYGITACTASRHSWHVQSAGRTSTVL